MYVTILIAISALIPTVQLARPSINLTFIPDEKYMSRHAKVDILCSVVNPTAQTDSAQLWYVDYKTGKRTPISRSLLTSPTDDAPEVFKAIKNRRYEYMRKNHIQIRSLQMEDSARYECNCPDCEESITKQSKNLYVMKTKEPTWEFESSWPLHENTRTTIKCQVDNFYPYVGHRILRDREEITTKGKSSLSDNDLFPQKFVWEANVTPTAEWHNSTLSCSVRQGLFKRECVT
jgi:hypothetical protein